MQLRYPDFVQRVRRYRPSELLPAVAAVAARLASAEREGAGPQAWRRVSPWGLAAIAKVSICNGNEFRSARVGDDTVERLCLAYHSIYDPAVFRDPDLGRVEAMMVRFAYEQFGYQESIFAELTRTWALFVDGPALLDPPAETYDWASIVGADIRTLIGVAFLISTSAMVNGGFFDPRWLDRPDLGEITDEIDLPTIEHVTEMAFVASFDEIRAAAKMPPPHSLLEAYGYNPLHATPYVRMPDGRLLAPQPSLVLRRVSPGGLFYTAVKEWQGTFTKDLGRVFEAYIGRQLQCIPDATVLPEITYRTTDGDAKSVDWFVILEDLIVLVEAKSTRLPMGGRAGTATLAGDLDRAIGVSFRQINRTEDCIARGLPEFARIPTDRPRIGITVTLDPFYIANSPLIRQHLPSVSIPTVVAASREIEALVASTETHAAVDILNRVLVDEVARNNGLKWIIGSDFRTEGSHNPILDEVWSRFPWATAFENAVPDAGDQQS